MKQGDLRADTTAPRDGKLGPVRGTERLVVLDALRGFAILGILLVNIESFHGPDYWLALADEQVYSHAEQVLLSLIAVFFQGKFLNTLAFLFGLGFALQSARADARGRSSGWLLARRLAALALFGVAHALFVWSGDVLLFYALLGFPLILFRRCRPRTLLVWAGVVFAIVLALNAVWLLVPAARLGGIGQADQTTFYRDLADSAQRAYGSGSYADMSAQRVRELAYTYARFYLIGPPLFAMMLVGAAAARASWARDPDAHERGIRRVAVAGLLLGLPLNVLAEVADLVEPVGGMTLALLGQTSFLLGVPALALGYVGLATLLLRRFSAWSVSRRLAEVGRMALTNYLLQSIVMTAIFYGLGLYGHVGLVAALSLCVVAYTVNFVVSALWLDHFSYGPVEWLWRRLTYGRRVRASARSG